MDDASRSKWALNPVFQRSEISYHRGPAYGFREKEGYFQSAKKGQEFVFEANGDAMAWFRSLLDAGLRE